VRWLDLFAGGGGTAQGLHAAGHKAIGIEWDEAAHATHVAAGFPCIHGDVRDLKLLDDLGAFDAVWSSFPCQDWSTAGKREGPKGERNGWPWTVDVLDEVRPEWFVGENVQGLIQHKGACEKGCIGPEECPRAYFERVILEQLRARFAWVGWRVLDAADYGTPQFRKRVFIVAGPRSITWPAPTHCAPEKATQCDMFGREVKRWWTVREALGLGGYVRTEQRGAVAATVGEPCPTVGTAGNQYLHASDPGSRLKQPMAIAPSFVMNRGSRGRPKTSVDEPCPTVATPGKGGYTGRLSLGCRRLEPSECAVLMGWPADYPLQGNKSDRYRIVGNGVVPIVAQRLAEAVGAA